MKKAILKAFSLMLVAVCLTACSNDNGKNDKEVTTTVATNQTTLTTTSPIETTTETPTTVVTTTTAEETTISEVTTPPQTSETKTETSTTTEKETTVTTTKATTTTTTTKKKTTTTTTKKKTTTTTTVVVDGKTMYVLSDSIGFNVGKNLDWWDRDTSITLSEGDKVTAYETVTADTPNGGEYTFTKVKLSNGTTTYVLESVLAEQMPVTIKITQSDVDKLVNELQEYSNSKSVWKEQYVESIWYGKWFNTYEEYCDYCVANSTPSNSSWHTVIGWSEYQDPQYEYSFRLYDDMLTYIKEWLDYEYSILPNSHQVVYAEYTTNSHTGATKWDIYLLY